MDQLGPALGRLAAGSFPDAEGVSRFEAHGGSQALLALIRACPESWRLAFIAEHHEGLSDWDLLELIRDEPELLRGLPRETQEAMVARMEFEPEATEARALLGL